MKIYIFSIFYFQSLARKWKSDRPSSAPTPPHPPPITHTSHGEASENHRNNEILKAFLEVSGRARSSAASHCLENSPAGAVGLIFCSSHT